MKNKDKAQSLMSMAPPALPEPEALPVPGCSAVGKDMVSPAEAPVLAATVIPDKSSFRRSNARSLKACPELNSGWCGAKGFKDGGESDGKRREQANRYQEEDGDIPTTAACVVLRVRYKRRLGDFLYLRREYL